MTTELVQQYDEAASSRPGRSSIHAWYVTFVLCLCYTLAFLDSKLPLILVESIKADLGLSDTQIGIITGPAFSLTYALLVIPVARLSDLLIRKYVIATAIAVWSAFTASAGVAQSFIVLLLTRTGVAIGESALTPAAHSMMSDMFPAESRAKAIAVYSCGISFGSFLALALGGYINDNYGWRAAMLLVGATGIVLTLLMLLAVREPSRQRTSEPVEAGEKRETIRSLFADPVIRHTIVGGTLLCVGHGATAWFPAYMIRSFSMTASEVGITFGAAAGLVSLVGTLFGGWLIVWLSREDQGRGFRFLALAFVVAGVLKVVALVLPGYLGFLSIASIAVLLLTFYPGPTFGMIQSRIESNSRSFASAVALFCFNGAGIAFGTFITGWLSDLFSSGDDTVSLRWALVVVSLTSVWSGAHYLIASRRLPTVRPTHTLQTAS